ncbi:MAG TPA: DeoR/GlpR family DNA-binding transcription regulator [Acidimicrobiales bacterium]|nr:DeoR/GlpR family DNA-binding transcription regulator [Acidimicrobiales bacterium]
MIAEQRRREILGRLRRDGYVEAGRLARDLAVDASTVRRDLDALARAGLVQRAHGGALPVDADGALEVPYDVKRTRRVAEKAAIAEAAAALVDDGASLILDSGSTTLALARALAGRRELTVATNDLQIALELATRRGVRLLVVGGQLIDSVFTLAGPLALAGVAGLRADWAFLGADAIDAEAGVTNLNTLEVPLKQAMIDAAERCAVLADSSKFGRRALAPVAPLERFERILTDDGLPEAARPAYGARLVCVPSRPDRVR